jgi:hypothetical protein
VLFEQYFCSLALFGKNRPRRVVFPRIATTYGRKLGERAMTLCSPPRMKKPGTLRVRASHTFGAWYFLYQKCFLNANNFLLHSQ